MPDPCDEAFCPKSCFGPVVAVSAALSIKPEVAFAGVEVVSDSLDFVVVGVNVKP